MSSLVSDFIINPVLRQARRFSRSSATLPDHEEPIRDIDYQAPLGADTDALLDDASTTAAPRSSADRNNAEPPSVPTASVESTSEPAEASHMEPSEVEDRSAIRDSMQTLSPEADSTDMLLLAANAEHLSDEPALLAAEEAGGGIADRGGTHGLPADDGMGTLRKRILSIHLKDLSMREKGRLTQELLMERYNRSQDGGRPPQPHSPRKLQRDPADPPSPTISLGPQEAAVHGSLDVLKFWQSSADAAANAARLVVSEDDRRPTYRRRKSEQDGDGAEEEGMLLGCEHYLRNVKLQCSTCNRWYTCRFCHDAVEDHTLVRKETKNMLCMLCGTAQRAAESCSHCGETAARYYCGICKLWDDDPERSIYHCDDCGICRVGRGLGKDFFHCKTCEACISIAIENSHKCIERSTDCDCPICGDYMFTSPKTVVFMSCGHSIHSRCYTEHMKTSYRCPICNRSVVNMETQFRNLDLMIQNQPMPDEFRDTRAVVLCNDCCAKSSVSYHWIGLKCGICHSYNTVELQILAGDAAAASPGSPHTTDGTMVGNRGGNGQVIEAAAERAPAEGPAAAVGATASAMAVPATTAPRPRGIDIPQPRRRRHSSNVVGSNPGTAIGGGILAGVTERLRDFSPFQLPDRLARSVSPYVMGAVQRGTATLGPIVALDFGGRGQTVAEADEDTDDEWDFWGSDGRRAFMPSPPPPPRLDEDDEDESESEEEDDEEEGAGGEEDEEEDEADEIALFGHP